MSNANNCSHLLLTRTAVRSKIKTERGDNMKEIIKSKFMVGFIVLVLGITYVDSINVKRMEQVNISDTENLVVMNGN